MTMNVEISNFDDLLRAARAQPQPQRLLFVFAGAELPDDSTPEQRAAFESGEGGALAAASRGCGAAVILGGGFARCGAAVDGRAGRDRHLRRGGR